MDRIKILLRDKSLCNDIVRINQAIIEQANGKIPERVIDFITSSPSDPVSQKLN